MRHTISDERFAAGDADFVHPESDEDAGEMQNLVKRHQGSVWHERHVFGHAIDAPEIADIGDGDSEIRMDAAKPVAQLLFHFSFFQIGKLTFV